MSVPALHAEPALPASADDLVDEALRRVCEATGSSSAMAHDVVVIERALYFADVRAVGSPPFVAACQALEGRSVLRYLRGADGGEAWPGELCPTERFASIDRSDARSRGAWRMLWQPGRVRSVLGATIEDGQQVLGAVRVVRRLGEPAFGRGEAAALKAVEFDVRELCVRAARMRMAECNGPDVPSHLVFDDDGGLVSASENAAAWVTHDAVVHRIGELVRRHATGAHFVRRGLVRIERLLRSGGQALVIVQDGGPHRPAARERLTATQRTVADLAVAGATVKEIAQSLGRSPETVRGHLKAVYDRLGIGSRVELGRVMGPARA